MVAKVIAYVEFDPMEIIRNTASKYGISVNDITMDDIWEYIDDNITYLDNKNKKGDWMVGDGPSIEGFESRTYEEIYNVLEQMQETNS